VQLLADRLDERGEQATAAITAEPIATPLVIALVVLPTASRLTSTVSASPSNSPAISAMPAELSDTGPKLSSETTIPASTTGRCRSARRGRRPRRCSRRQEPIATPIATAIAMIAHTEDSRPIGDAREHRRRGSGAGGLGDLLHRRALRRGEVLGDQARGDRPRPTPVSTAQNTR
jgi:hypothetical protein